MKRILEWLENKIWRKLAAVRADGRNTTVGVTTTENAIEENSDSDHTTTVPALTSLEESSFIVVEQTGFDPYNSGSFETSKSRLKK